MSDIYVFHDDAKNCIVLKDGETMRLERERTWAENREKVKNHNG